MSNDEMSHFYFNHLGVLNEVDKGHVTPPCRIDVIGQNGNDGDHYQLTPEQFIKTQAEKSTPYDLSVQKKLHANDKQEGGTHYKEMGIEPWEVIDTWPLEQRIGAYRAGILKYVMRLGSKDEMLKEAKKCSHYSEKLIEVLEESKDD